MSRKKGEEVRRDEVKGMPRGTWRRKGQKEGQEGEGKGRRGTLNFMT
jgi:hypothetical protein